MTDPARPERLLARWESIPGALRWVADVGRDQTEAWLAQQRVAVEGAAALAARLEQRMLAAVGESHGASDSPEAALRAAVGESHGASDSPEAALRAAVGESHGASDSPEAALRAEFDAVRGVLEGRASAVLGVVSGALAGLWQRARVDASDVFDQLGLLLEGGTIETRGADGRPVAITMVDWQGDLQTVWTPGVPAWQTALHRENVAVALRAREAALDGVAAAARGAARLTALIAAPAQTAAVLTLPIAWRYLRRLWHMSG